MFLLPLLTSFSLIAHCWTESFPSLGPFLHYICSVSMDSSIVHTCQLLQKSVLLTKHNLDYKSIDTAAKLDLHVVIDSVRNSWIESRCIWNNTKQKQMFASFSSCFGRFIDFSIISSIFLWVVWVYITRDLVRDWYWNLLTVSVFATVQWCWPLKLIKFIYIYGKICMFFLKMHFGYCGKGGENPCDWIWRLSCWGSQVCMLDTVVPMQLGIDLSRDDPRVSCWCRVWLRVVTVPRHFCHFTRSNFTYWFLIFTSCSAVKCVFVCMCTWDKHACLCVHVFVCMHSHM